ncbi:MAG: hypothetical protein EHM47_00925 [Ignavibacteriales bacterium]|nr:MAG: hypothetical protein EHM47_00925 [Ignavibacteriales bacterium]
MKNKRGDFTGLLYLVVMIAATAMFLLIAGYIATQVSTAMNDKIGVLNNESSAAFDSTTNVARNSLSAVWFIVFGGLLLGLFITAWNIPSKPIYVPVFIILLVIAIIVGVAMSNAYEQLYASDKLEDIAGTQGSINFIMSNLPYTALIIGIITLIITYAKPKLEDAPLM